MSTSSLTPERASSARETCVETSQIKRLALPGPKSEPNRSECRAMKTCMAFAIALISGCATVSPIAMPPNALPDAFKESGIWLHASPQAINDRNRWWQSSNDKTLDELENKLENSNADLAIALARYEAATSLLSAVKATELPELDAGGAITHNRQSNNRPLRGSNQPDVYGADTLGLSSFYEVDLWGRVRNAVAARSYESEAARDDVAAVTLSLQGGLAKTYFKLRSLDAELKLLNTATDTYSRSLAMTENRFKAGISPGEDVTRARRQLHLTLAEIEEIKAQRAILEHTIATYAGIPASSFSIAPDAHTIDMPSVEPGLPSTLIERRPDVAAAERRAQEANAQLGLARVAFFPTFDLGLQGGYQSTTTKEWLTSPNQYWSIGPSFSLALFDAGLRKAIVAQAQARLDESSAQYRSAVLRAVQEVEDNLALIHYLENEIKEEALVLENSRKTLSLSMEEYRGGAVSYLEVVDAQISTLNAEQALNALRERHLSAISNLIVSLGGDWQSGKSPQKIATHTVDTSPGKLTSRNLE